MVGLLASTGYPDPRRPAAAAGRSRRSARRSRWDRRRADAGAPASALAATARIRRLGVGRRAGAPRRCRREPRRPRRDRADFGGGTEGVHRGATAGGRRVESPASRRQRPVVPTPTPPREPTGDRPSLRRPDRAERRLHGAESAPTPAAANSRRRRTAGRGTAGSTSPERRRRSAGRRRRRSAGRRPEVEEPDGRRQSRRRPATPTDELPKNRNRTRAETPATEPEGRPRRNPNRRRAEAEPAPKPAPNRANRRRKRAGHGQPAAGGAGSADADGSPGRSLDSAAWPRRCEPLYLIAGTDGAKIDATRARLRARAEREGGRRGAGGLRARRGRGRCPTTRRCSPRFRRSR